MTFEEIKEAEDDEPCTVEEVADDEGEAKAEADEQEDDTEVAMAS